MQAELGRQEQASSEARKERERILRNDITSKKRAANLKKIDDKIQKLKDEDNQIIY